MSGRKRNRIRKGMGERAFDLFNYVFLAVFSFTILFPFWNLLVQSFSAPDAGYVDALQIWPEKFSTFNYEYVLSNKYIWIGYRETLFRTIVGTFLGLLMTAMGAYVLSKKTFAA